jgi:RNA polymerase sigma-70 factor (ECF subfamily)
LHSNSVNDDRCLILEIRKGDKKAFELIFNRYNEKLYFFALGYLHSSTEAEEVIQQVFVSLWENRSTLIEVFTLKDYLYKAVINKIYNYFKHQAVRLRYQNHMVTQESLEDDHSQQSIYFNDLKGTLENLIEELPTRQQQIFKLNQQEGLSPLEIANCLGLSVRSVENQIYRAMKYIKKNLSKEYYLSE